ncbi:TPA: peptide chain release factor N(5)-glutamine methyltransferase [Listeria innocua]|uniref:Release factor glutamine methyltransferase n=1 Tax=Listeria innocua serovar 6a (strain ATCC BAA-680 / CLIP 11262) TaxID=272626 RepID=Q927V1_LISIN|nr:peptide chain release factor N(5)-glutamine methyltransferase [Listeria innocua]ECC1681853.1 peptide chain release factor N(5)-glutamine methyltransferase [Listeria innocua]EDO1159683.1 peptide chain release factor N(5)-glutamine methyltransferase [Listeria innocua]EEQ0537794.1 peptide chain release factor N(5)-glutamine methyltransferase [Listeria innocua]EHD9221101.1 peptide chain release factor N(5)-glutamine methyltransferase [Listeria innocua]EHF3596585.1 peptide chain release factor N
MTQINQLLKNAEAILLEKGLDQNAAEILLETRMGLTRSELWMEMSRELEPNHEKQFQEDFARYLAGEPVQYILKTAPFYGYDFLVTEDVLIPRPETEELVATAEAFLKQHPLRSLLDVCTGSGIIAIALKKAFPDMTVTASDISAAALAIAKKNSLLLNADVRFVETDLLESFKQNNERFDMIVANPPYISEAEKAEMSDYVLKNEPSIALFAENDGLAIYERFVDNLKYVLNPSFWVGVEIGYTQGERVKQLFEKSYPHATVLIHKDINSKDRYVTCSNILV